MANETQGSGSCCGGGSANLVIGDGADAGVGGAGVAGGAGVVGGAGAGQALDTPAGVASDVENGDDATTCPVMAGSAVSKRAAVAAGLFRDFEGERYYFCCAGCGPAFDADPARYAAVMG